MKSMTRDWKSQEEFMTWFTASGWKVSGRRILVNPPATPSRMFADAGQPSTEIRDLSPLLGRDTGRTHECSPVWETLFFYPRWNI